MANLILRVTLKNGSLDVDQSGNGNQMDRGQSGTITWELTGNAVSGSFNAIGPSKPGFAWKQQPPSGIFGTPALANNGKQIQMSDNNTSTNSAGSWSYQLYATVQDTLYSTISTLPIATTTDPTIKNN